MPGDTPLFPIQYLQYDWSNPTIKIPFLYTMFKHAQKYLQYSPTVYHDISIKNTIERFFVVSGEITTSSWLLVGWHSPNILKSYIYIHIYILWIQTPPEKVPLTLQIILLTLSGKVLGSKVIQIHT